ncbi:hypothetical protein V6N13_004084 [Hibiscus sabdariffa]|uniref:Uncharacterized protein n=1 Tax=Hibiscus sabdariffa TaxID=183260 RepID=A0ABR2RXF5_9ROSI
MAVGVVSVSGILQQVLERGKEERKRVMDSFIASRWRELSGENNWMVFFNLSIPISAAISFTMVRWPELWGTSSTAIPEDLTPRKKTSSPRLVTYKETHAGTR